MDLFDTLPAIRDDMLAPPDERPSLEYLGWLLNGETPEEAVTFSAYLLPSREAVWWGHQCLHHMPDSLGPQDHQMLGLAEDWVREPDEPARRNALDAAMAAPTKTPGVWIAFGAGWSGGSMAPAGAAEVPPPPFLCARAVNIGILALVARVDTRHRKQVLDAFVRMAVKLTEA